VQTWEQNRAPRNDFLLQRAKNVRQTAINRARGIDPAAHTPPAPKIKTNTATGATSLLARRRAAAAQNAGTILRTSGNNAPISILKKHNLNTTSPNTTTATQIRKPPRLPNPSAIKITVQNPMVKKISLRRPSSSTTTTTTTSSSSTPSILVNASMEGRSSVKKTSKLTEKLSNAHAKRNANKVRTAVIVSKKRREVVLPESDSEDGSSSARSTSSSGSSSSSKGISLSERFSGISKTATKKEAGPKPKLATFYGELKERPNYWG